MLIFCTQITENMMKRLLLTFGLTVTSVCGVSAQEIDTSVARHDFFYAGQSKQRRMFIVKDGQVNWTYQDPLPRLAKRR